MRRPQPEAEAAGRARNHGHFVYTDFPDKDSVSSSIGTASLAPADASQYPSSAAPADAADTLRYHYVQWSESFSCSGTGTSENNSSLEDFRGHQLPRRGQRDSQQSAQDARPAHDVEVVAQDATSRKSKPQARWMDQDEAPRETGLGCEEDSTAQRKRIRPSKARRRQYKKVAERLHGLSQDPGRLEEAILDFPPKSAYLRTVLRGRGIHYVPPDDETGEAVVQIVPMSQAGAERSDPGTAGVSRTAAQSPSGTKLSL